MSYQNRYSFTNATKSDAMDIHKLFASQSFDGNIGVQYLRGDNPIDSFLHDGDSYICLVVRDTHAENKLVGIGCCIIRKGYIRGKVCNVGYLTGLKIHSLYQKKFTGIAASYQWLYDNCKDKVDYFYTTILSENVAVQKMLEKKRKSMPIYHYLDEYDTFIFKTGGKKFARGSLSVAPCSLSDASNFYAKLQKGEFSTAHLNQNFLQNADYYGLYKDGLLLAIASVSDRRMDKQYVVKKYAGAVAVLRFLPTKLLGYPAFPKLNEVVSMGGVAIYSDKNADVDALKYFFSQILAHYIKAEILMIGLTKKHKLYSILASMKSIRYGSKLYQVSFEKNDLLANDSLADIDISFQ